MTVRIGISGWRYAGWRGVFYPEGLIQKRELAFAAEQFATIELNGSFYSLQRPELYARWCADVPDDFVFAIKGSRYITHMLRLRDAETALANFFASGLFELGDKIGPILWQLPPTLRYDAESLRRFFGLLPRTGADAAKLARRHDERVAGRACLHAPAKLALRHALEVRHRSFIVPEFIELLRREHIALVVADTAGKWPLCEDVTADFVYVRLHGDEKLYESGYSNDALASWAERIDAWHRGTQVDDARTVGTPPSQRKRRDVFVYFDNDAKVHAPFDAQHLAGLLGVRPARAAAAQPTERLRRRPRAL